MKATCDKKTDGKSAYTNPILQLTMVLFTFKMIITMKFNRMVDQRALSLPFR